MYSVYKHTNLSNGRVYIGVTSREPKKRWQKGNGYRDQPLFWNAIKVYGWDGFSHEVLFVVETQDQAFSLEQDLIAQYQSTDRTHGYNISGGGMDSGRFSPEYRKHLCESRSKRPPMSEETKRKISEARRGKSMPPCSKETRERLSKSLTGRTFSKEHCEHIRESKIGKACRSKNHKARKVLCVETGIVYDCLLDAADFTKGSSHNISSACTGRLKTSGGYHWKYYEEV